ADNALPLLGSALMTACRGADPTPSPMELPVPRAAASVSATTDSSGESSAGAPGAPPRTGSPSGAPEPSGAQNDEPHSSSLAGVSSVSVGVHCKRTTKPGYRTTGSPRFAFCLDIPSHWREGDRSGNGDGSPLFVDGAETVSFYGSNMEGLGSLAAEYEYRRTL